MKTGYSLWDGLTREADILEDLGGSTLVDRLEWLADVVLGISSAMEFPTLLVKVAICMCGRNIKALIKCGSMGNYIKELLVPALGMEVILEKNFEMLEMPNKTIVKVQLLGYISF